jgi:hypothetical protein
LAFKFTDVILDKFSAIDNLGSVNKEKNTKAITVNNK